MIQHTGMQRGDGPTRWPIMRARLPVYHLLRRFCSLRPRLHNPFTSWSFSSQHVPVSPQTHQSLIPYQPLPPPSHAQAFPSHMAGAHPFPTSASIPPYFSRSFPSRSPSESAASCSSDSSSSKAISIHLKPRLQLQRRSHPHAHYRYNTLLIPAVSFVCSASIPV